MILIKLILVKKKVCNKERMISWTINRTKKANEWGEKREDPWTCPRMQHVDRRTQRTIYRFKETQSMRHTPGCPKIPQVFQIASLKVDPGYLSCCNAPWTFSELCWNWCRNKPLFVWGFGGKCMEKSSKIQIFNFLLLYLLCKPIELFFSRSDREKP